MLKSEPTSPYKKAILYDSGLKTRHFFRTYVLFLVVQIMFRNVFIIRETYKPATFCLRTENSKI